MGLSWNTNEGWGLGLFFVFFPDEGESKYLNKKKILSSSTSFPSYKSPITTTSTTQLMTKAQSTISICAIIVFFTLLVFTLSSLDETIPRSFTSLPERNFKLKNSRISALQGLGILFRRGTRSMSDLIVVHLSEDLNEEDFRVFLRTLHLSGITSRADVVLIFPSKLKFSGVIQQENESFLKLVQNSVRVKGFDLTHFTRKRQGGGGGGENIWGRKIHNHTNSTEGGDSNTELSYGSVVGFEASEVDPADSLSGFLDHVPIRLRRWACYPMLLGRVRRNFKHIMLVDAKDIIILSDSLARVGHKGAESVHLWKSSEKTRSHDKKDSKSVTANVIMGGMRGVRLLSNAMLNEIVGAATRKSKNSVSDSAILSQLVKNDSLLRSLSIVTSIEPPVTSSNSLVSINSSSSRTSLSSLGMVHRDTNTNLDINFILLREICSSVLDSFVYRECNEISVV